MHHRLKKDAPAATARAWPQILADTRRQQLEDSLRHAARDWWGAHFGGNRDALHPRRRCGLETTR